MQMNDFMLMLAKIVISVCVALITAYAVPYIKTLKEDARYASVLEMIEIAVRAAEQVIKGEGQGALKKAEVVKFVSEWLERKGIGMSDGEIDQIVEFCVYQLKQDQK